MSFITSCVEWNHTIDLFQVVEEGIPVKWLVVYSNLLFMSESVRLVDVHWLCVHLVRKGNLCTILQSIVVK